MSKKIFVLFLSVFIMLFTVSAAMGGYQLLDSDKMQLDAPDGSDYDNPEYGYVDASYKATYSKPAIVLWGYGDGDEEDQDSWQNLNFSALPTYTWTLSPDISGLSVSESGNTLVISGTPTVAANYDFGFIATVSKVNDTEYNAAVGTSFDFSQISTETLEIFSGNFAYRLAGADDPETDLDDPEADANNPERAYTGSSYKAVFTKPEIYLWAFREANPDDENEWHPMRETVSYDLAWALSPDIDGLTVFESADSLILSGSPNTAGNFDFDFIASVSGVNDAQFDAAKGTSVDFSAVGSIEILSGDYEYKLAGTAGPDDDLDSSSIDGSTYNNTEEGYAGSNYKATYTRPSVVLWEYKKEDPDDELEWHNMLEKTSFDIEWTISPDVEGLVLTLSSDDKWDTLILSGVLPDVTEDTDYTFDVIAKVVNVSDDEYKDLENNISFDFEQAVTLTVLKDSDHTSVINSSSGSFNNYVVPDSGIDAVQADTNYSITVKALEVSSAYMAFIQSDDNYHIDIPAWLKISDVVYAEESDLDTDSGVDMSYFDATPIKSLKISFNSVPGLKKGTAASITIPYYDNQGDSGPIVKWNVTYTGDDIPEEKTDRPFGISGEKEVSFSFTEPGSKTGTVSYYGTDSIKTEFLSSLAPITLSDSAPSKEGYTGTITLTATVPYTAADGDYSTTYRVIDANDTSRSGDVSIKINVAFGAFNLSADKEEINLVAGGDSATVTLSTTGARGDINWESVDYDTDALTVAIAEGSNIVTISANEAAEEGSYPVKIKASDGTSSSEVTITVKVTTSGEDPDPDDDPFGPNKPFKISTDAKSFDIDVNVSQDVIIKSTTRIAALDWLVSGDEYQQSGITVDLVSSNDVSNDVIVNVIAVNVSDDTDAGVYTVIITATNGANKQSSVSFDLTVNDFDFIISADAASIDLTAGGDSKTVTVTANKKVVWTLSNDNSEIRTAIKDHTDKSAVITVTPVSTSSKSVYTFYVIATDKAGNEKSVAIDVTISNPVSSFDITADPDTLNLISGGESGKSTITVSGDFHDTISWAISDAGGLNVTLENSTDLSTDVIVTAGSSVKSGDYSISVTATDGYETQKTTSINVKVTVKGAFTLSANPSTLNLTAGGDGAAVTLSTSGRKVGNVKYSVSQKSSGLDVVPNGNVFSIAANSTAAEGTKTVTIIATDESEYSASVTITVNVTTSGGGSSSKAIKNISDDVTDKIYDARDTLFSGKNADDVIPLNANNFAKTTREISSLDEDDYAALGEKPVIVLPEILASSVTESNIYVFAVDYDEVIAKAIDEELISVNEEIFIHMIPSGSKVSSEDKGLFADDEANEIKAVPADGEDGFNIAAYLEAGTSYLPVITVKTEEEFTLTADPVSLDFVVDGDPKTVTVTANRQSIAWVISDVEDFTAEITASDDTSVTITVTPGSVALEGLISVAGMDADYNISSTDVTIKIEEEFTLTPNPESIDLFVGGSSKDITVNSNKTVVSWDVSCSSGITAEITASSDTSATIAVTPGSSEGSYTVTVMAMDEDGTEKSVDVAVSEYAEEELALTAVPSSLSLNVGGSSKDITVNANKTVVSWDVSCSSGITAEITESDDTYAIVTVTPGSSEGSYTVTVMAMDEDGTEKSITSNVTVSKSGSSSFSLTAVPTSLSLVTGGDSKTARITASGNYSGTLRWSISYPSGLFAELSNTTGLSTEVSVSATTAAATGSTSITIRATDSSSTSQSVTIYVNVSNSGDGDGGSGTSKAVIRRSFDNISTRANQTLNSSDVVQKIAHVIIDRLRAEGKTITTVPTEFSEVDHKGEPVDPEKVIQNINPNNKYIGLNMVSADNEGFYKIGKIPAADLIVGTRLFVQFYVGNVNTQNASVSSEGDGNFALAASTTNSAILMDNSGNIVDSVPSDLDVTLIAQLDSATTYSPVVTLTSNDELGSSGAGCNSGFGSLLGLMAMAFTASSLYIRKKS